MIKLGTQVNDTITDFKGIVIAKAIYLSGCIQYLVQPKKLKDSKIIEAQWIDEGQLEGVEVIADVKKSPPGGGIRSHP
jgi:hypothetical protein